MVILLLSIVFHARKCIFEILDAEIKRTHLII